jgi:hypothetical protein
MLHPDAKLLLSLNDSDADQTQRPCGLTEVLFKIIKTLAALFCSLQYHCIRHSKVLLFDFYILVFILIKLCMFFFLQGY